MIRNSNSIATQSKQAQVPNAQLKQLCNQIKEQGGPAYEFLPLGRAKGKVAPWELEDGADGDYEGSDDWGDGEFEEQLSRPGLRTPEPARHTSEPDIIELDDSLSSEEPETSGYHRNAAGRLVKVRNMARDLHTGKFSSSRPSNTNRSSDPVPSTSRKRPMVSVPSEYGDLTAEEYYEILQQAIAQKRTKTASAPVKETVTAGIIPKMHPTSEKGKQILSKPEKEQVCVKTRRNARNHAQMTCQYYDIFAYVFH